MGRALLIGFRWGLFLLACAFLWAHLAADKGTRTLEALRAVAADPVARGALAGVLLLLPVNWWLESLKWRRLMAPVERVGPWRSFAAVVAGTSVALVTPNRTGEFLGRVLFLEPGHRVQGAFATALGSISQFVVTLVAGGCGLLVLVLGGKPLPWSWGWTSTLLVSLTAIVASAALVLYLFPGLLRQLFVVLPFLRRMERASAVLNAYPPRELWMVLALSGLRYTVFAAQFIGLLLAFGVDSAVWVVACAVPVVYLVATLVPTVLLMEIGVRGSVAVALFAPLGGEGAPVLLATTMVWTINLVLPALVGSVLLVATRFRTAPSTVAMDPIEPAIAA